MAPLGWTGLQEIFDPTFTPPPLRDEVEQGVAGLVWLVELQPYEAELVEVTY
jgi:hypothetical protein